MVIMMCQELSLDIRDGRPTCEGRNELVSDDVLNGCKKVTSTRGSTHGVVPCTLQAMDKTAVGSMRLGQGDL